MSEEVKKSKEMSEWISVKDRLPDCKKVLAIAIPEPGACYNLRANGWFRDTIYSCWMNGNDFIIESHGPTLPATHWMPLPKPPGNKDTI